MENDFRLGDWLVQPLRDCIERGEETVHLKPKAMAVLVRLARAGGAVVTRDELFDSVWPGAVVSDATLTQCVVELRHAFGDSARDPGVIETVPRKGFRLIPPVIPADGSREGETTHVGSGAGDIGIAAPGTLSRKWRLPLIGAVLLALAVSGYWAYGRQPAATAPADDVKSLAVLPFADLSEDRSERWFADGLAEELRGNLTKLRGLQLAGGISSSRFDSGRDDLQAIATALRVDYVLLGSVRQKDDRLRVTAHLVDAATGLHLWSETFDRPRADIFDVQAEISESVAVALSISLGVGELGNAAGGTTSFQAYELKLRADQRYAEFTPESMIDGIALLEQAVTIDPNYAMAWVRMAVLFSLAPMASGEPAAIDWLARSQDALEQARRLEPDHPALLPVQLDLHMARGEWAQLEREMRRAGEADTVLLPDVHFSYGIFLGKMGRAEEALAHLLHASRLEPLAPYIGSKLGHMYLLNGRIEDALAEHDRVWDMERGNRFLQSTDGLLAALAGGDRDTIARWLDRVIYHASDDRTVETLSAMRHRLDDSESAVAWLRAGWPGHELSDYWAAVFASWLGDTALALDALLRYPDAYAIWVPFMADVRRQPGFRDVVHKLGLAEYWREFTWADFCRPVGADDFACE